MRSTLFFIPEQYAGLPIFGLGWLLIAWVVIGIVLLVATRLKGSRDFVGYLPLWAIVAAIIVFLLPGMMQPIGETGLRGLPVRGFGVMMLIATVSAVALAAYRARQMNVDPDVIFSLAFWMFAFGIAGARLFYVVQYWSQFQRETFWETVKALASVTEGGLVVYGSVIFGLPAGLLFLWRKKLPVLAIADVIAPSMVVGLAFGRIGCFLNGCCYGGFCEATPPGLTFPASSPPYQRQESLGWTSGVWLSTAGETDAESMERPEKSNSPEATSEKDEPAKVEIAWVAPDAGPSGQLKPGDRVAKINGRAPRTLAEAQQLLAESPGVYEIETEEGRIIRWRSAAKPARSAPIHPAQLYAAIDAALLALVLWNFYPFRRRDGEVIALLLTVHPVSRFLLEMIRSDEPGQFGTALTISQWLSIAFLAVAAVLWWYIERQPTGSLLPLETSHASSTAEAA